MSCIQSPAGRPRPYEVANIAGHDPNPNPCVSVSFGAAKKRRRGSSRMKMEMEWRWTRATRTDWHPPSPHTPSGPRFCQRQSRAGPVSSRVVVQPGYRRWTGAGRGGGYRRARRRLLLAVRGRVRGVGVGLVRRGEEEEENGSERAHAP